MEKLKNIYIQLKEIMSVLYDIEQRHPNTKVFREQMEKTIQELNKIDHNVLKEAFILKKEEEENER